MKEFLESLTFSILVNESPTTEFKLKKRLSHDHILSHFLYLIVAEGLESVVRHKERIGGLEDENSIQIFASILNCNIINTLFKYLCIGGIIKESIFGIR